MEAIEITRPQALALFTIAAHEIRNGEKILIEDRDNYGSLNVSSGKRRWKLPLQGGLTEAKE